MSPEKKQRLSRDLTKSYTVILGAFFVVVGAVFLITWEYLKEEAKRDVVFTRDFMAGEFMEKEEQTPRELFEDVERELPDMPGIDFQVSRGEERYSTGDIPNISLEYVDRVREYSNYSYYIYNYKLPVYGGDFADIVVVKNMKEEKRFIGYLLRIFMGAMLVVVVFIYCIYRHFYNKIIPQLKEIEGITNTINLDNLDIRPTRKGYYEEFENILVSYGNMLTRIEDQTNAHIEFVHNASHELKTPIFVIKGYGDILSKWGLEDKEVAREAVEAIGREVRGMQSLTEKLLFLAKGREMEPTFEEVDIAEVICQVEKSLSHIYRDIGIKKMVVPGKVSTDRELFKLMLKNIVENAMKYGSGRDIDIKTSRRDGKFLVVVEDHGEGMTPEEVQKAFSEFYRGERSRNKDISGHGLGLSIVKGIGDALGVEVEVFSEKGLGTKVKLLIKDN